MQGFLLEAGDRTNSTSLETEDRASFKTTGIKKKGCLQRDLIPEEDPNMEKQSIFLGYLCEDWCIFDLLSSIYLLLLTHTHEKVK